MMVEKKLKTGAINQREMKIKMIIIQIILIILKITNFINYGWLVVLSPMIAVGIIIIIPLFFLLVIFLCSSGKRGSWM